MKIQLHSKTFVIFPRLKWHRGRALSLHFKFTGKERRYWTILLSEYLAQLKTPKFGSSKLSSNSCLLQLERSEATRMKTKLNILTQQDTFWFCAPNYMEVYIMKWDYRIRAGLPSASGKCGRWLQYRISPANIGHVGQTNFHVSAGPAYTCKCRMVAAWL